MRSILKTACLLLPVASAAFADVAFADDATRSPAEPAITVMSTDVRHEVYREHEGPYWSIAPTIALVRDYMIQLNERGPIFVRYMPTPSAARKQPHRIEVGFVTRGKLEVATPFQYSEHPAELVAGMRVSPDQASPSRALPRLRAWALSRGYEVTGILTEIHSLTVQPGGAREPVEVQLVITAAGQVAEIVAEPQDEAPDASREWVPAATSQSTSGQALLIQTRKADPPEVSVASERPAPPSIEDVPPVQGTLTETQPATLAELAAEGRYDQVAELLIPNGQELQPAESLWLGQVLFRFGAAARGVVGYHPEQSSRVTDMVDALDGRYRGSTSYARHNPLKQTVSRVERGKDARAASRSAITRDLDRILGRIAWQTDSVEEIRAQLIGVLVRVHGELQVSGESRHSNQP